MAAINFDDFDEEKEPMAGSELSRITELVRRQLQLEKEVAEQELALKDTQARLRQVQEVDLPEMMRECGFEDLPITVLGVRVTIKKDLTLSIPKAPDRLAEVMGWLRGAGLGDLIERDVIVPFARGEEEKAETLLVDLQSHGLPAVSNTSVNTARVKAAVREFLAAGKDVPLEMLGGFQWTKAVIK